MSSLNFWEASFFIKPTIAGLVIKNIPMNTKGWACMMEVGDLK